MWAPPEHGRPYTLEEVCRLYPGFEARGMPAASENRAPRVDPESAGEITAPADRPGVARREDIIAVQTAETLESLQGVSAEQLLATGEDEEAYPEFDNAISNQELEEFLDPQGGDVRAPPQDEAITVGWSSLRKGSFLPREKRKAPSYSPVSYTHLTLPTKRIV